MIFEQNGIKVKICGKCKEQLQIELFSKNKNKPDGLQAICKMCKKDVDHKSYLKHQQKIYIRNKNSRFEKRQWLQEYKLGKSCIRCGESHPACLSFHHKRGMIKLGDISNLINSLSLENIIKEIEKCEIICPNYHEKEHWNEKISRTNKI